MQIPRTKRRRKPTPALWALVWLLAGPAAARVEPAAWPAPGFQRGITYSSWDGSYPFEAAWRAHLDHFEALGVTWIEVLTFTHQPDVQAPAIALPSPARWPRGFIAEARRRGFKILLKPHVWSRQFYDGSQRWRGSIKMQSDADWAAWFAAYERFIVQEARLAAEAGVEMFSVGLEYVEATRDHDAAWRRLIAAVRAVYPGTLTYSADANHELGHVQFWDALDVIGVNAYLAVADVESPSDLTIRLGLVTAFARLGALAAKFAKPIVLTEVGYPSVSTAAMRPWAWPSGKETVDAALQARLYEATIATCAAAPWCQGMYWWKWYEKPEGGSHAHDYSPEGKPAEAVLKRWYRGPAPTGG